MATGHISDVVQYLRRATRLRNGAGMTDGQLLESFLSCRDEAAIEALVLRHGPMVWGVCRRVLGSHHDAEDAFQATFLVLVRKAASIVPREMVANWLHGVAHQTALKARATAAKRRGRERQVMVMPEPAVAESDLGPDLSRLLDQELSGLPDKYRVAIVLCDLEGKSRKEAARQLALPEGTVASRLIRARALLAKRLARHGLPVSGATLAVLLSPKGAMGDVPASVVSSTIKAATALAAGAAAAGLISVKVATLTEGVLKAMLIAKFKTVFVLVGMLGLLALGLSLSAYHGFAQQSANEARTEFIPRAAQEPATPNTDKPDQKQPEPYYCWLVFGPKGKVRALVRLDGEALSIDRDGKRERFKSEKDLKDVVIVDPDGKTSYVITAVHVLHTVPPEKFLEVRVRNRGSLDYPQGGLVQLATDKKTAPQTHFHGPLTVTPKRWRIVNHARHLVENDLVDVGALLPQALTQLAGKGLIIESTSPRLLNRTGTPTSLSVAVTSVGEGSFVVVCSSDDKDRNSSPFPKHIHPMADVEFPAKKPGAPSIKTRYPLDQFCCDGTFQGPVKVPDEVGAGKAKLTFSFEAWTGARVAPTTVEIPVEEPKEENADPKK
jgi:RNA polymerase sigma factor (sigma-70 family)